MQGLTSANANFEGILVANASFVNVFSNAVVNNKSLNPSTATCPGIPDFETAEGFDCGEGIHLMGVDHSTVANNIVTNNAGGILLSDETGPTFNNLITGNQGGNNPYDCGITLASHPPATSAGSAVPLGVYHNTVAANKSFSNGLAAGGGMSTPLPGGTVSGNVVINNTLKDNGLPGVALHGHTPGEFLSNNAIVGNWISGNGADSGDAATPGPTGINIFSVSLTTGTVISQNVIYGESNDIVVKTPGYTLRPG